MILTANRIVAFLALAAFGGQSLPTVIAEPAPSAECVDDPTFMFNNDPKKDCNWVGRVAKNRCSRKWKGLNIHTYCPDVCGECPNNNDNDNDNNSNSCVDDPKFRFNNEKQKNCNWVGLKPDARCSRSWKGLDLGTYCPQMCNRCPPDEEPAECEDDKNLRFRDNPKRDCGWVAGNTKERCKKSWKGKKLNKHCPVTCGDCPQSNPDTGDDGCCSLDYKQCINWCGPTKDSCLNCNHHDGVGWLENGPPQDKCKSRWKGCAKRPDSCCPGLTCREDANDFLMCLPILPPTTTPTASPTGSPSNSPTALTTVSPSTPPTESPSILSTSSATTIETPTSISPSSKSSGIPTNFPSGLQPSNKPSSLPIIDPPPSGPCCSLDFKTCIDWCGSDYDSCVNCNHHDGVFWLENGPPQNSQCLDRWTGCENDFDGCCDGLTCQPDDNNYLMCLPSGPLFTKLPTKLPTANPTSSRTDQPTQKVSTSASPSASPSNRLSSPQPTASPTALKTNLPTILPTALPTNHSPEGQPTESPSNKPSDAPQARPSASPSGSPTSSPTASRTSNPTNAPQARPSASPSGSPTPSPSVSPQVTNAPQQNNNGCCSLDYKNCIDWCGSSYDSCMNCANTDVGWLPNGAPSDSQCGERWTGCNENNDTGHSGCCSGLTCQMRTGFGYFACLPNVDPTPSPVPPPPTDAPTGAPTIPREPTTSPAPTSQSSLLSTDKAMNAWDVYLGLDFITHKNSANPPNYALVASGGAAGSGNLVVSESQAYGLLITGTVLASWNTHAGRVPNSKRSDVLNSFEGYFNFWVEMSKNSSNKGSNCQSGGNYCTSSFGFKYVCLPDWRHYKTGGSESTGPAPDADEDAIVGIILAVKAVENDANKPSWYETARKWADASATAFFEFEVDKSRSNHRLVKLGSCWGGWESAGNNPSYHSPGSFRVMRDYQKSFPNNDRNGYSVIPEDEWNKLINTSHEVLRAVQCSNDGALVPNWATIGLDGNGNIVHTGDGFSGSGTPQYEYGAEAARATFRVALDAALYPQMSSDWSPYLSQYNWRLDSNFQSGSFSSSSFPSCRGPNTKQNINMFGGWQSNAFIYGPTYSSLIAASSDIGNAAAMIDVAGEILGATPLPSSYYPRSWAMISNLMLNGAMESAGNTLKN